jgi:hypothetical protein
MIQRSRDKISDELFILLRYFNKEGFNQVALMNSVVDNIIEICQNDFKAEANVRQKEPLLEACYAALAFCKSDKIQTYNDVFELRKHLEEAIVASTVKERPKAPPTEPKTNGRW